MQRKFKVNRTTKNKRDMEREITPKNYTSSDLKT